MKKLTINYLTSQFTIEMDGFNTYSVPILQDLDQWGSIPVGYHLMDFHIHYDEELTISLYPLIPHDSEPNLMMADTENCITTEEENLAITMIGLPDDFSCYASNHLEYLIGKASQIKPEHIDIIIAEGDCILVRELLVNHDSPELIKKCIEFDEEVVNLALVGNNAVTNEQKDALIKGDENLLDHLMFSDSPDSPTVCKTFTLQSDNPSEVAHDIVLEAMKAMMKKLKNDYNITFVQDEIFTDMVNI